MAFNIISADNSQTTGLQDTDGSAFLLVTEGGYIATSAGIAYSAKGGHGTITVEGSIISQQSYAMYLDKSSTDSSLVGYNQVIIATTGVVRGRAGGLGLSGAENYVENHGIMSADFYAIFIAGEGTNYVSNTGSIKSNYYAIFQNLGDLDVRNSGIISGKYAAVLGYESLDVNNIGTIDGSVRAGDSLTLNNSGFVNGSVFGGQYDDVVDTTTGSINGLVQLGGGADAYAGGDHIDRVDGGADNDSVDLGAGNDVYFAANGDGNDQIDGGDGIDRYDASDAVQACIIDLSAGTTSGPLGNDLVLNFENITGGSAGDTLTGDDGANRIDGGMGADKIDGGAGSDRLIGGTGTDTITGGVGRDTLTGGLTNGSLDSDTFVFRASDSGTTAATRDRITDFTDHGRASGTFNTGADLLDLHLIDANIGTAGDQAFSFNATTGASFSGAAGSLIWQQYNGFALVSGDTNGDKIADFTIQLNGTHTLFASDFVL